MKEIIVEKENDMPTYKDIDAILRNLPDDLPYKASVKRVLIQAPEADVVEVVRCKDCVYWDRENIKQHTYSSYDSTPADFAECIRWSNWAKCNMTRYNDYCSLAEECTEGG